jgi:hypothetical protein
MVVGHMVIEAEIVKQPGCRLLNAHHCRIPRQISRRSESGVAPRSMAEFFNGIHRKPSIDVIGSNRARRSRSQPTVSDSSAPEPELLVATDRTRVIAGSGHLGASAKSL